MDSESHGDLQDGALSKDDIVGKGSLVEVKAHVGPRDKDCRPKGGQSLLFWAASRAGEPSETIEICRYLIDSVGIDVNEQASKEHPWCGRTALFLAAQYAPPQVITYLLEKRADLNAEEDQFKQTPLFCAARRSAAAKGCREGLESLLERRADANHLDHHGQTALFYAAKASGSSLVAALLKHSEARDGTAEIAVNLEDRLWRQKALFYAARDGTAETCALLIEKRCTVDSIDCNRQSALFYAAKRGDPVIVELLLSRNAVADRRDKSEETPLFYAVGCWKGVEDRQAALQRVKACRILMDKGQANPGSRNLGGHCLADLAMKRNIPELVDLFKPYLQTARATKQERRASSTASATPQKKRRRARGSNEQPSQQAAEDDASSVGGSSSVAVLSTAQNATGASSSMVPEEGLLGELPRAILKGTPEDVRRLLASGHDPEAASARCGVGLLSLAAMRSDRDDIAAERICRILVEECRLVPSCAPTETTRTTALFHAVERGLVRCCSYLLAARCEVQHRDEKGRTALFMAAALESPECLTALLDAREDPNVKDLHGRAPIFEAAAGGHASTVGVLLQRGAVADLVDRDGKHTLDVAAPQCVAVLVGARCDPNVPRSGGVTPLLAAVRQSNLAKVQALLEARADASVREELSRRTPLHEAVDKKQLKVCRKLMEFEADVAAQDADGATPLSRARESSWQIGESHLLEISSRQLRAAQQAQAMKKKPLKEVIDLFTKQMMPVEQVKTMLTSQLMLTDRSELQQTGAELLRAAAALAKRGRAGGLDGGREEEVAVEVVRHLVEHEKIDPSTKQGSAAIFRAASNGNEQAVAYLIEKRCNVDTLDDENGATALFAAVQHGHMGVISTLVQLRANVNHRDRKNVQTALFFAARKSAECVSILLKARAEVDAIDTNGQTSLFYASCDGMDAAVKELVNARADVNRTDPRGRPALFFAIKNGQAATAAVLLDEFEAWPQEGESEEKLHDLAAQQNMTGIVGQLDKCKSLREMLLRDAANGTAEDVDRAIQTGASCIVKNKDGHSALHLAAAREDPGGVHCVKRLVEAHSANINALDRQEQTPLFAAVRGGRKECVLYLLNTKCDPCHTDVKDETALFEAARNGHQDVVALLIERGVSPGYRSKARQTAAFPAAHAGSLAVLARLLDSGARANDVDRDGRTALFGVHTVECAQLLLDRKCSVDTRDASMRTALFEAEGHAVMRFLLDAGAAVNAPDSQQQTALFKASERGDIPAVRALLEAKADGSVVDSKGQTVLFGALPGASLELVRLLVCQAHANPAVKDANGKTAQQVAKTARKEVADYLQKAVKDKGAPVRARGAAGQEPVSGGEKRRRYRFEFTDPSDPTEMTLLQWGTPQYIEALLQLGKQCPWLRIEKWVNEGKLITADASSGAHTMSVEV